MDIVVSPDPGLRQVCEECDLSDKSLKKLAKHMAKAMYDNYGCGLAAPQVGISKRMVVVDCDVDSDERNPLTLVNPVIIETSGEEVVEEEGCLSCPGISAPVKRKPHAVVRFFDLEGEEWVIEGEGLLGRCLQHEVDHLNGITLFESCLPEERIRILQEYEEAKAAGAKPGETSI